jgi:hypothetical protein
MAIHNNAVADVKSDLYATIPGDGVIVTLLGNNTRGDINPVDYLYDASSTASDNYPDVIQPTLQTGNGRFLKVLFQQYQADWNQASGSAPDFIKNKPSLPGAPTINNSVSRTLDSSFKPSTTQISQVNYTVQIAALLNTGTVFLEISADNSAWTEVGRVSSGTLTLTVVSQISAVVPANYFVRLRTSGAATITYLTGQEILY